MAFCAWCGTQVDAVSYAACPGCRNPTNGSQRVVRNEGAKNAGMIVGLILCLLVLVAVIGILAAIAIPNFVTAKNRAMQKRTMADMRSIATAIESYATVENAYPEKPMSELAGVLVPKYLPSMPTHDAWGTELRYECWPTGECRNYAIGSAGADKVFEHGSAMEYEGNTKTTAFDNDILFTNGSFAQYPEGAQK